MYAGNGQLVPDGDHGQVDGRELSCWPAAWYTAGGYGSRAPVTERSHTEASGEGG